MKPANILLIGLLTVFVSGCVAAVAGGAAAGGYYVGKDERTAKQIALDAKITSSVKTALIREEDVKARNINVDTRNNHVTLHGHVASASEAGLAVRIAEGAKDVTGVTSKLEIKRVDVEDESI